MLIDTKYTPLEANMADLVPRENREVMTLRDAIDRLFEDSFVRPWSQLGATEGRGLAVDVVDEGDHFAVEATLPGVNAEDVDVRVEGNLVNIKAETKRSKETAEDKYTYRERYHGVVQRSFTLPTEVSSDKAEAKLENGVLRLSLPKVEKAKTHKIKVSAK